MADTNNTKAKGLAEILAEDPNLTKKSTYEEIWGQKPKDTEMPLEKAYADYAKIKQGGIVTSETTINMFISVRTENPKKLYRTIEEQIKHITASRCGTAAIKCVSNVISYDTADKYDKDKLCILSAVVNDILSDEPSDADLGYDDDAVSLYGSIRSLKESLARMGIFFYKKNK